MPTFHVKVAYCGTNYFGWQKQKNKDQTIQAMFEKAIKPIVKGKDFAIIASGRTDAGVHAHLQSLHIKLDLPIQQEQLLKAINFHLPKDVRIVDIELACNNFHAQKTAIHKTYRYFILHNCSYVLKTHWPFLRNLTWYITYPLDYKKMREETKSLNGRHDFIAFQNIGTEVKTTERTMFAAELIEHRNYECFPWMPPQNIKADFTVLEFRFTGSGFLKQMVRNLVGTIVDIGRGAINDRTVIDIIASRDRNQAGITAPAYGLFLDHVEYEHEYRL